MSASEPFFREAGQGLGVICLHSNAASSTQWRALMDRLSPRFHVLAADSYGAGKSPPWPRDRRLSLDDEVALLDTVFERAGAGAGAASTLVGHSYGGAIALMAALRQPQRVRALVLYEPTLFALLRHASAPPGAGEGIQQAVDASIAHLAGGDPGAAAAAFIDYWMGPGAYAAMPEARRGPIAAAVVNVAGWAQALTTEPTPPEAFAALRVPMLLMVGERSPASSRGVAQVLLQLLPQGRLVTLPGLGHMGPVTHPDVVNAEIERFLDGLTSKEPA